MDATDIIGFLGIVALALVVGVMGGMQLALWCWKRDQDALARTGSALFSRRFAKTFMMATKATRWAQDAEWNVPPIQHRKTTFAHLTNPHFLS